MPEIETTRLILRPFKVSDFADYHRQLTSDVEVMRNLLPGKALSREEAELFFNRFFEHWKVHQFGVWILRDKESGELIGQCGLRWCYKYSPEIEMVYAIAKSHWGKGIACEAALASIRYGFEQLNSNKIMAIAAPTNLASQRVMQKIGLKYDKNVHYYGKDYVYYTISQQDWQPNDSLYILRQT